MATNYINSDQSSLKAFAEKVREEARSRLTQEERLQTARQQVIEPMVEKYLNAQAFSIKAPNPQKISFVIQDKGGNGDLIFGVKAFKILSDHFPGTSFLLVTNGVDKLKKILNRESLNCPIKPIEGLGLTPSFDRETTAFLETSDLVIASPTGCFFLPPKVVENKRDITLLEYNRPDYGLNIPSRRYVTGIGEQALGIFIDRNILPKGRCEAIATLEDRSLAALLTTFDPGQAKPLYFGYGHKDVARYISTLLHAESKDSLLLTPHFQNQELLIPKGATVIVHQNAHFMKVLQAHKVQGAAIDIAQAREWRQETEKLLLTFDPEKLLLTRDPEYIPLLQERMAHIDQMIAKAKGGVPFVQSLENGFSESEGKWWESQVLSSSSDGPVFHIIVFNGLSFADIHRIKDAADEICLSTGDMSFSEDISRKKLMMYDTRKREPIEALANSAKKRGLHLIGQYFLSFASGDIPQTTACLKQKEQLRKEADILYTAVNSEMDLAPQLIGLIKRQISGHLDAQKIHTLFTSYVLDPKDETLAEIADRISSLD